MTGYGSAESNQLKNESPKNHLRKSSKRNPRDFERIDSPVHIEVSIKTLNSRYFEAKLQLPPQYQRIENRLKLELQKYFKRGRVDVFVKRRILQSRLAVKSLVRSDLAHMWMEAYKKLGSELKLLAEPSLEMLVRLPDIIVFEEDQGLSNHEERQLLHTFQRACEQAHRERSREGIMLKNELRVLVDDLEKQGSEIHKLRRRGNEIIRKQFLKRISDLGFKKAESDPRFVQEVALIAEKYDISEEIVRLKEHIQIFRSILEGPGPQGKKLDFYTQELLREINTIGSKCQMISLIELVVEMKSLLERIKEQVQNIQ